MTATMFFQARHWMPGVANHLWQCTLYVPGVALVAAALKKQQARIRYGLWLSATIKFLIPFSVFTGLGGWLGHFSRTQQAQSGFTTIVQYFGRPLAPAGAIDSNHVSGISAWLPDILALLWLVGSVVALVTYAIRWRVVRAVRLTATALSAGREVDALRNAVRSANVTREIPLLSSAGTFEPGIVGVRNPSLLWPRGISEHLGDGQIDAIMLHEAWHVRRRDNLTAMLQMLVEVIFWFHPLVWWLGSRLISERERACDEAVLQCGSDPRVYAESILEASKFCVESPLACVAGVTGSDLKQRMVRIMTQTGNINLGFGGKVLLSTLGIAITVSPVLTGAFSNQRVLAAADAGVPANLAPLETSTIRPGHGTDQDDQWLQFHNGDLTFPNVTVRKLILYAYDLKDYQITGAPAWIDSERFDVKATWNPSKETEVPKVAAPAPPPPPPGSVAGRDLRPLEPVVPLGPGQLQSIIRLVLATRFGLQVRSESRNLPGFAMEVAAGGAKLPKPIIPVRADDGEQIFSVREMSKDGAVELGEVAPLAAFADQLSQKIAAPVVNKTQLAGTYDVTLRWTTSGDQAENIRTALHDQLGLELFPMTTATKMLSVEQVKPPSFD